MPLILVHEAIGSRFKAVQDVAWGGLRRDDQCWQVGQVGVGLDPPADFEPTLTRQVYVGHYQIEFLLRQRRIAAFRIGGDSYVETCIFKQQGKLLRLSGTVFNDQNLSHRRLPRKLDSLLS